MAVRLVNINLIYFRPSRLNLFYEKVFAEVVFSEPELLSSLGSRAAWDHEPRRSVALQIRTLPICALA